MKWFTTSRAVSILLLLVLIVGGGNLWATFEVNNSTQQAEQRQAAAGRKEGQLIERKLCATFAKLGERKPPAGSPKTNPSRAYLQGQHDTLDEIPGDIGCGKRNP